MYKTKAQPKQITYHGSFATNNRMPLTHKKQFEYIFSKRLVEYSGAILIITVKSEVTKVVTIALYFDNLLQQITYTAVIMGRINITTFDEFVTDLANNKMINSTEVVDDEGSILTKRKYATILLPKAYNRDWVQQKYLESNIIFESYLLKDELTPQVLKDLYTYVNIHFRTHFQSLVSDSKYCDEGVEPTPKNFELFSDFNKIVASKLNSIQNSDSIENQKSLGLAKGKGLYNYNSYQTSNPNQLQLVGSGGEGGVGGRRSYSTFKLDRVGNRQVIKRWYKDSKVVAQSVDTSFIAKTPRKVYSVDNIKIITSKDIKNLVEGFKREALETVMNVDSNTDPSKIRIRTQFRVKFANGLTRSASSFDTIDGSDKDFDFLDTSYLKNWSKKYSGRYKEWQPIEIMVSYKFLPSSSKRKLVSYISEADRLRSFSPSRINSQIPTTMDFDKWGNFTENKNTGILKGTINKTYLSAHIVRDGMLLQPLNLNIEGVDTNVPHYRKHIVSIFFREGGEPITFTDVGYSEDSTTFTRRFDKITFKFVDGKQTLVEETSDNTKFISKIKPQKEPKFKIITMDLETREIDGKMSPVCISIYTKTPESSKDIKRSFAIWGYDTADAMLIAAFKFVMVRKYYGYSIYFHNFSYFDSIFLLKTLVNMPDVEVDIQSREGKLLKLRVKFDPYNKISGNKSKYNGVLYVYDSQLILPVSLAKLSKTFSIASNASLPGTSYKGGDGVKSIFPLKMLNDRSISLDYNGEVPPIKFFHHPDPTDKKSFEAFISKYQIYKKSFDGKWNLKHELIKYCEQDVIVLHNVLTIFTKEIYSKFEINVLKYPTLPSIAFAIYRRRFMTMENIPIIKGAMYNDMKNAFLGGFVDVYKPYGENVNSYDANSLYPSSMLKYPMPVGKPKYIEGEDLSLDNIFGFVYVKVYAPNLKTPILPCRHKDKGGVESTIYPTGTWHDWYFTEELKNARKYGYHFQVFKGYHFEKSIIFSEYVETLYKIKESSSPDDPWYTISKLLLNSLFGRFGMSPDIINSLLINSDEFDKYDSDPKRVIVDSLELGNKTWIKFKSINEDDGDDGGLGNISVSVAAAITSWSRIQMSHYIMKYSDDICNIDTDGIKVTCELSSDEIGPEIGKMKFEGRFKEAVFIAPKVYGGIKSNGETLVKVKGLKSVISYSLLKTLLYTPNAKIAQYKWYRNFSEATINVVDQLYTLSATDNKRELIRDSSGRVVDTTPYTLVDGYKISTSSLDGYYRLKYVNPTIPIKSDIKLLSAPPAKLLLPKPKDNN